jgi:hypothetical protein
MVRFSIKAIALPVIAGTQGALRLPRLSASGAALRARNDGGKLLNAGVGKRLFGILNPER